MAKWIHKGGLQEIQGTARLGKDSGLRQDLSWVLEMAFIEQEGHQGALKGGDGEETA